MFTGVKTTYIKKNIVKIAHSTKPNRFYEIHTQNTSEAQVTTKEKGDKNEGKNCNFNENNEKD